MANDLEDGKLYLLEDEGSWVPTVANIDLAGDFTEGTDYCELACVKQFVVKCFTGITVEFASGGNGFMTRTYRRGYSIEIQAEEEHSALPNIHDFIMANAHVASSSSTYVPYYLIFRYSSSDYASFYDDSGTKRDYIKGAVIQGPTGFQYNWNENNNQRYTIKINFVGWVP